MTSAKKKEDVAMNTRIPADIYEALEQIAKREFTTISAITRKALANFIRQDREAQTALKVS